MESICIRDATAKDAPALAALHVQVWAETYLSTRNPPSLELRTRQWRDLFDEKEESWFCLVMENGVGRLIGFAKGQRYEHPDLPEYHGELNKIYLLREYQGIGLGKQLFVAVTRRLLEMGISNMVLFGVPQNPSCGFYEAMGGRRLFAANGEFHGGYGWKDLNGLPGSRR